MKMQSTGFELLLGGLLLLGLAAVFGLPKLIEWKETRERRIVWEEMVRKLRRPEFNEEGWWVGDIAELYRLGQISREVAEADTAPLNPLVPVPIPYHGYYVRAMESGPSQTTENDTPTPLKGKKRSRQGFAICIYPEHPGPRKYTWIECDILELRTIRESEGPVLQFPTKNERQANWSIVD